MDTILAKVPESNAKLLKRSFTLYMKSFYKVYIFAFLFSIIFFIPKIYTLIFNGEELNATSLIYLNFSSLILNLLALIFFIAILWHVHCVNRRIHEPILQDFSQGVRKVIFSYIGALIEIIIIGLISAIIYLTLHYLFSHKLIFHFSILSVLLTMIVFILSFLIILYVVSLFYFVTPIIVIENKGILHAIEKSMSLVWNHWWRVFSLQITPWLAYLFILLACRAVFNIDIHIYFTPLETQSIFAVLINLLLFAFFIPWVATTLYVQLKDLELRKAMTLK